MTSATNQLTEMIDRISLAGVFFGASLHAVKHCEGRARTRSLWSPAAARSIALALASVSLTGLACAPLETIVDDGPQPTPAELQRDGANSVFSFGTQITFAMGDLMVERERCTVTGPRATAHCNVYDALFPVQGVIAWTPSGRRLDRPLPVLAWVNGVNAEFADAEALLDDPGRWNESADDWVYVGSQYGQAEAHSYFSASPDDWTDEPLEITCAGEPITEAFIVYRGYTAEEAGLDVLELQTITDEVSERVPPLTVGNGTDAVFEYVGDDPQNCPPQP